MSGNPRSVTEFDLRHQTTVFPLEFGQAEGDEETREITPADLEERT